MNFSIRRQHYVGKAMALDHFQPDKMDHLKQGRCMQRSDRFIVVKEERILNFVSAFSFYGIIDLLAILPGFIVLIFSGMQSLLVIRAGRLLRIFRILKFSRYTSAGSLLVIALQRSREKIEMFMAVIVTLVVI